MFKILANVGDDLVVGTHKGNVGIMSRCIMEDEGLVESKEMDLHSAFPNTDTYWLAHFPEPLLIINDDFEPNAVVSAVMEVVDLKLWRYGDFLIRVGYSKAGRTWVKSEVSEATRRMHADR